MPRYESRVARIDSDITIFWLLSKMSWIATKLYNTALWNAKETWDKTGKIPSGFDLQKFLLASYYHVFLPAHTYQHPAHQVGNAFKSWYKLRKTNKTARPPGFRKKEELSAFMVDAFKLIDIKVVIGDLTGIKKNQDGTGKNWSDKPNQNYAQIEVSCIESEEGCSCVRTATPYKMQTIPALIRRGVGQGD